MRAGQSPFGCVIVRGGAVLAEAHNTVWRDRDPTAHAEVNALRAAARAAGAVKLRRAILYASCEPCPMCLAAAHWAGVRRVYYGATIAMAQAAGFDEMPIPAARMARLGSPDMKVERRPLPDASAPFALFAARRGDTY